MKENNEHQASAVEINLQELMLLYLRKWWAIALCCIVGAAMMFTYTKLFVTPMYQSNFSVYINNSRGTENSDSLSSADLSASSWLVNGYMEITKKDHVLGAAAERLGGYTAGQLRSMVSTRKVDNTQIFYVYVTHSVPAEAQRIANAIADVIPTRGAEIVDGSSAKVIDRAKLPGAPISPSYTKSIAIGGLLGVLVAIVFLTIRFLRDTRIRDEEELLMLFDLPVLGRIPDFEQEGMTSTYEYVKKPAAKEEV
jgi:capsular polysaccharide biosynthesis protein